MLAVAHYHQAFCDIVSCFDCHKTDPQGRPNVQQREKIVVQFLEWEQELKAKKSRQLKGEL